jgi:hypothetical protein
MADKPTPAPTPPLTDAEQDYKDKKTRAAEDKAGAPTLERPVNTKKLARGGGIESRGKTKGRFV